MHQVSRARSLAARLLLLPQVFATNSHADTFCPYLAAYIKRWRHIPDGAENDPERQDLTDGQRASIRRENVIAHPWLVAEFFHLKMQLYLEHICVGILNVDSYWVRYEWQMRGTTHAHYFLW